MSDFLEQVLKAPAVTRRASRGPTKGLSGSGRRYAVLLTLMAGMTAVPSWVILKAGVNGLGTTAAAPIQPLLAPASRTPGDDAGPPEPLLPEPVVPRVPAQVAPPEPAPVQVVPDPVLERRAVVDTPDRPVRKKPKNVRKPVTPPASVAPTASPQPHPADEPSAAPVVTPSFVEPSDFVPAIEPPVVAPVIAPSVAVPSVRPWFVRPPFPVEPAVVQPPSVVGPWE